MNYPRSEYIGPFFVYNEVVDPIIIESAITTQECVTEVIAFDSPDWQWYFAGDWRLDDSE
jgi:hypothetical protein